MVQVNEKNKMNFYVFKSSYNTVNYGASHNRWIYFIENISSFSNSNNIIRVYDQIISQSDLLDSISLSINKTRRSFSKLEYQHINYENITVFVNKTAGDIKSESKIENKAGFENIALELEHQTFTQNGFNKNPPRFEYDSS